MFENLIKSQKSPTTNDTNSQKGFENSLEIVQNLKRSSKITQNLLKNLKNLKISKSIRMPKDLKIVKNLRKNLKNH